MKRQFVVIIPARFASTRLPGKPLLPIGDKPLVQHVYEHCMASGADAVYIATDNEQIRQAADIFNADVVMTSSKHFSGTERIAEACNILQLDDDAIVVNVQGDEFGMPEELVNQVAYNLADNDAADVATLCEAIMSDRDMHDSNVVKVVFDEKNFALYFSRAAIPFWRDHRDQTGVLGWRHIGIYAYRAGFVKTYAGLPAGLLERREKLEQLRAMTHGYRIHVGVAVKQAGIGVDTEADLKLAREQSG